MADRRLGLIMNGVTGRMGKNQHLIRSILAISNQGGVRLPDGTRVMPDPLLVGRNPRKVEELAEETGVRRWTTDLAKAFEGDEQVYFDATLTATRAENVKAAIAAGKHVYCEKPTVNVVARRLSWRPPRMPRA
jgi:predicted dehydrogenase